MSETLWKWRMFLFVRAVDATAANRAAFGAIFANNGSLETAENEALVWDACVRLSVSGEEPAQAFGVNTVIKPEMRDDLRTFLDGLTNARYVVVANTELPNYRDGEFVLANFVDPDPDPTGKVVSWEATLAFLNREFGLQVIQDSGE